MPQHKILITGGAGFIGSNLVDYFLEQGHQVVCLDNLATGKLENLRDALKNPDFKFIEGDIRNYDTCLQSVKGCSYVLHQAALGSVPRSVNDPVTTSDVNIGGFVKMLFASKEAGVRRFIYAASSSTYGDYEGLPKVEDKIGKPLSPYAITKVANELFAQNFSEIYNIETIGLRYFNVFGRRQDPNGAYAAAIPKFVKLLMQHKSPVIDGDGENSRDFTYIDNVLLMNRLAMETTNSSALNTIFNTAYGERTTINLLVEYLKNLLTGYDPEIAKVPVLYGPARIGDVPHSLASIEKAKSLLEYDPQYDLKAGLKEAINWYWNNL
jgi:UDP-N-acetylglucosamine/UDP-N-acetylgalactosamine 4-epimerase